MTRYSPRPGYEEDPLDVYWDGDLVASHAESGIGNSNTSWMLYQFEVLASTIETLLEFRSTRLDGGTYLDAVSVNQVGVANAVPEPASVAVWSLLCLVGFGLVRRRKRHA